MYVAEPSDCALTETVLIQTTPLKMSAHMAVIDAIMGLYVKEQVSADRLSAAVRRVAPAGTADVTVPAEHEEALMAWINVSCTALSRQIESELEEKAAEVGEPVLCVWQSLYSLPISPQGCKK